MNWESDDIRSSHKEVEGCDPSFGRKPKINKDNE